MNKEARFESMEKWKAIIDEANQSGIGIRRWCNENGITASQYYYWRVPGNPVMKKDDSGKTQYSSANVSIRIPI